jgi:6-phosphogluconolactonase
MKILFKLAASFISLQAACQEHYLLVGTYDSPKSEGVYVYRFNSTNGDVNAVSHFVTSNPSYLTVSPNGKYVYSVNENGKNGIGGEVTAFSFDKKNGQLSFINRQFSGGDHPCYIETDKTGKWVFTGNYSTGSLAVFSINAEGGLSRADTVIKHLGKGKNENRQQGPHVHCTVISPDNKWLLVPDLGIDKTLIYAFDNKSGKLSQDKQYFISSEPGAGPRHFTFHPNNKLGYLVEELSGTIVAHTFKNGKSERIQRISTMPAGDSSFAGSADIHISPDGKFLYASNRGNVNNIAVFSLNKKGKLSLVGHQSTLGITPRHFNFDPSGKYLLVCNQNSDEIVIFKRDVNSGLLYDSGKRIQVGKPVCIKWINP